MTSTNTGNNHQGTLVSVDVGIVNMAVVVLLYDKRGIDKPSLQFGYKPFISRKAEFKESQLFEYMTKLNRDCDGWFDRADVVLVENQFVKCGHGVRSNIYAINPCKVIENGIRARWPTIQCDPQKRYRHFDIAGLKYDQRKRASLSICQQAGLIDSADKTGRDTADAILQAAWYLSSIMLQTFPLADLIKPFGLTVDMDDIVYMPATVASKSDQDDDSKSPNTHHYNTRSSSRENSPSSASKDGSRRSSRLRRKSLRAR